MLGREGISLRFRPGHLQRLWAEVLCTQTVTVQRDGTCMGRWAVGGQGRLLGGVILNEHHFDKVSRKDLTRAVGQGKVCRGIT